MCCCNTTLLVDAWHGTTLTERENHECAVIGADSVRTRCMDVGVGADAPYRASEMVWLRRRVHCRRCTYYRRAYGEIEMARIASGWRASSRSADNDAEGCPKCLPIFGSSVCLRLLTLSTLLPSLPRTRHMVILLSKQLQPPQPCLHTSLLLCHMAFLYVLSLRVRVHVRAFVLAINGANIQPVTETYPLCVKYMI
jgi:hypothetical protein